MVTRSAIPGFSTLLQRLARRVSNTSGTEMEELETPAPEGPSEGLARGALAMMFDEAIGVLRGVGLPHDLGFYRWDPHRAEWAFLSSSMTPAERWAMVLDAPTSEGWRYANLPQLVRLERPDDEVVLRAADVLEQGAACLADAYGPWSSGGFEGAIKLAMTWADFRVARIVPIVDSLRPLTPDIPPNEAGHLPSHVLTSPKRSRKAHAPRKTKSAGKA